MLLENTIFFVVIGVWNSFGILEKKPEKVTMN